MLSQLVANGLITGVMAALLGVGFAILYSGSRFFVFTFGVSYTYAAYGFLVFSRYMPFGLAGGLGVFIAVLIGLTFEVLGYRRLRHGGQGPMVLMLASIGFYIASHNLISITFGDSAHSIQTWPAQRGYSVIGSRISGAQIWTFVAASCALTMVWWFLRTTSVGVRFRAVAGDPGLARIVGVPVEPLILLSTAIGSALAGLGGVLAGLDTGFIPAMGFQALLVAIITTIVGGIGSLEGALAAGFCLGLAQNLSIWKLPTQWQDAIVYVILIGFLLCRPKGFLGQPVKGAAL